MMNSLKREFLSFKTSDKKKRIENEVSRIRDVSEWELIIDRGQISMMSILRIDILIQLQCQYNYELF